MEPTPSSSLPEQPTQPANSHQRLHLAVDARWVIALLLLIIIAMFIVWRPWSTASHNANDRTIKVSGEATVKSEPDQYVFSPNYQFSNADRTTALDALAKKNTELVAALKKLGVTDAQIKSNADDYRSGNVPIAMSYPGSPSGEPSTTPSYNLQLTITLQDKALTQKVQDYLTGTTPTGSVTPYASFSDAKRKQLESQARDEATKDARSKAEQSAKNLGFTVGDVKTVSDGSGFGMYSASDAKTTEVAPALAMGSTSSSIAVQPGQNELSYSVSVEYFVR